MYFLIIAFGFLLAMRGARPAPLQKPEQGFRRIWRENTDLFLTLSLLLTLWLVFEAFAKAHAFLGEYTILELGFVAYFLSRFQKKTDAFFLSTTVIAFAILSEQNGFWSALSLAWAVSMGIALFQTCLLGLRHRLLFSGMPSPVKGWPILCLLAAFISIVLWGVGRLVF